MAPAVTANALQVGIALVWWEGNPCNIFAAKVKEGAESVGLHGMRFNTIGVSDGTMGTYGTIYIPERIIADSIETIMRAQLYDGMVAIPGFDRNIPEYIMAMHSLNRPSLMVYGASIMPGFCEQTRDRILESCAKLIQGEARWIGREDDGLQNVMQQACRDCGRSYTASTMAISIEAMGMTLPASSAMILTETPKSEECERAGRAIKHLVEEDIKPRDILTRKAFENGLVCMFALGESIPACQPFLEMARACGVRLTIDDIQAIRRKIVTDPSEFTSLIRVGGTPALLRRLINDGLVDGSCLTVTGKSLSENLGLKRN